MRRCVNGTGFTLIELIIVMVTLGALAVFLMTALSSARESARRAVCANNLRQHGVAWYLYLDDYNGQFPRGRPHRYLF